MSATIRDDRSYKIDPTGVPGWRIIGEGVANLTLRHDTLLYDCPGHRLHGRPAEIVCPRTHLILADAANAASAVGVSTALPVRSAPAAESSPEVPDDRKAPGGPTPAPSTSGATIDLMQMLEDSIEKARVANRAARNTDEPSARATDPQPAHDAAKTAKALASERRIICLLAHEAAGGEGLTGHELEAATGIEYDVIGPRRPWLERNGFLEPNGLRRANPKGNTEGVYVITEAGRDMCRRLRLEGKAAA